MTAPAHNFPPALPGEEKEHAERLFKLAEANAKGIACKQNVERAFDAYHAAAAWGHGAALSALGDIFRTGELAQHGVTPIDLQQALQWYTRAERAGFHDALFGMGRAYKDMKDYTSAIACFERAAYLYGKREALREYGMCIFHGHGAPADTDKGREIIERAALMDANISVLGCTYLAANYGVHVELPKDEAEHAARKKNLKEFQEECAQRRESLR
jgi:TPR repeat protein